MASHGVVSTGALTPESFGLTPGDYATFDSHQLRASLSFLRAVYEVPALIPVKVAIWISRDIKSIVC
jgi:hypothetical protein